MGEEHLLILTNNKYSINCQNFDHDRHVCLAKNMGGGKHPTVFPSKTRRCELYKEKEA